MNSAVLDSPSSSSSDTQSQVFGLRYLEEDAADILEVAGCQGVVAVDDPQNEALTIKLCGDGFDITGL